MARRDDDVDDRLEVVVKRNGVVVATVDLHKSQWTDGHTSIRSVALTGSGTGSIFGVGGQSGALSQRLNNANGDTTAEQAAVPAPHLPPAHLLSAGVAPPHGILHVPEGKPTQEP